LIALFHSQRAALPTARRALWTTLRNASDFLYATTNAATRAATAATTNPTGLAVSAAFSSHWTAAHARAVPAATFCQTVSARVRAVARPAATAYTRAAAPCAYAAPAAPYDAAVRPTVTAR